LASSRKKPARLTRKQIVSVSKQGAAKAARTGGPRKPKTATNDETCLQMHCKQWLDKSGLWSRLLIFHVANERKGSIGAVMHFKRLGVRPGVADWLVFSPGRAVAIELKDDKGEQGANQEIFQKKWEAIGNLYFLVRTLEEFQGVVQGISIFA
jgi:hypothetical protein